MPCTDCRTRRDKDAFQRVRKSSIVSTQQQLPVIGSTDATVKGTLFGTWPCGHMLEAERLSIRSGRDALQHDSDAAGKASNTCE